MIVIFKKNKILIKKSIIKKKMVLYYFMFFFQFKDSTIFQLYIFYIKKLYILNYIIK